MNGIIVVTKPKDPKFRPREHMCWSSIMHFYRMNRRLSLKTNTMSDNYLHDFILKAMKNKTTFYGYFFEYIPNK